MLEVKKYQKKLCNIFPERDDCSDHLVVPLSNDFPKTPLLGCLTRRKMIVEMTPLASLRIERDLIERKLDDLEVIEVELTSAYDSFQCDYELYVAKNTELVQKMLVYEKIMLDLQSEEEESLKLKDIGKLLKVQLPLKLQELDVNIEINRNKAQKVYHRIQQVQSTKLQYLEELRLTEQRIQDIRSKFKE